MSFLSIGLALKTKGLRRKILNTLNITEPVTYREYSVADDIREKALPDIMFIESGFLPATEILHFWQHLRNRTDVLCFFVEKKSGEKLPEQLFHDESSFVLSLPGNPREWKFCKSLITARMQAGSANIRLKGSQPEAGVVKDLFASVDLLEEMAWVFDAEFRIVYMNKPARQFTYLKTGVALHDGQYIRELFPEDVDQSYVSEWRGLFLRAFAGEKIETTIPLLGNAIPFCHTILYPRKMQDGVFVIAAVRELGAKVQHIADAEGSTRQPHHQFTRPISDVFFIFDRGAVLLECKSDGHNNIVHEYSEFVGKDISAFLPPDLSKVLRETIGQAFVSEQMQVIQFSLFFNARQHFFEAKTALLEKKQALVIIRDITAMKMHELRTHENEKRFLLMLEHTGQILYDFDIPSASIKWFGSSKKTDGLSGFEFSAVGFKKWQEMIHPDDRGLVAIKRKLAEETHEVFQIEYRVNLPGDRIVYIEDRGAYMYDENGVSYRILGTLNDFTKNHDTHLALQKSEERYKAFVSQSSEAIWCFELTEPIKTTLPVDEQIALFFEQGYLSDCNNAYANMYGVSDISEIIGMPLSTVLLKDDPANISYLRHFIENGYKLDDAESVEADFEGKIKHFLNNLTGVVRHGCIERAWGTQRDITHLRSIELAQQAAEKKYREIFENAIEGIYQSSFEGYFLNINPAMAVMYGYESPFEMMQIIKNIGTQCYHASAERVKFLGLIKSLGKVQGFESMAIKKDGSTFWISENARLIKNEETGGEYVEGMVEDITRRKVAAQSLIEREELYRSLVTHSPDAIAVYLNNFIVFANPSCFEMFGADKPEDIIGKSPLEFVHPDSKAVAGERIRRLLQEDTELPPVEEKFIRLDGSVMYVEVSSMAIVWGGHPAVQVIVRDLSARKREEFIRESETAVFSMIAQAASLQQILNKICELNDFFYNYCNTVIFLNVRGVYTISAAPSTRYDLRKPLETLEQTGIVQAAVRLKMSFFLQNLAEETQWREYAEAVGLLGYKACWAKPIVDLKGVVYGVIVHYFSHQTTPLLYNEQIAEHFVKLAIVAIEKRKLEEENFNLSLVARQTTSAVSILDNDYQTIWINEGYEKLTGYSLDEMRGRFSADLLHGPQTDRTLTEASIEELKRSGNVRYETYNYTKDGRGYWVSVQIDKMYDSKNNQIGYFMIENDISERVLQARAVKEAQMRAEEASRLKSAFLANMSHEIRTPMNGILGFADILRSELVVQGQEELYKFSETIYNSGRRLLNLLNDILDISRIEADKLDIELQECRLDEILLKTITLLKPLAERKGLFLDYSGIQQLHVLADENRLHQVFNNIIGNAIKFTSSGGVTLTTVVEDTLDGKKVKIAIADTGRGIEAEFLDYIFEPFMQESTGFSRSHEGSGLGLAISQRLVKLMNGYIHVESEVQRGTTVSLYLTLSEETFYPIIDNQAEEDFALEFAALAAHNPNIFVVEDDETSRALFERTLYGFAQVKVASNGDDALLLFENLRKSNWLPEVILMDIGLPAPWDGVKLRSEFTKKFEEVKGIPIIAQTAYAMRQERENFIKEGFSLVLTKPLNRRELLAALTRYSVEGKR